MSFSVKKYWNRRYGSGKDSGAGSRNELAFYKSGVVNSFINLVGATSLIDFGCGDGNILSDIECENITGIDISKRAIEMCEKKMPHNTFYTNDVIPKKLTSDVVISLDVIFHLITQDVIDGYMNRLAKFNSEYIMIYAPDYEVNKKDLAPHYRPVKFSDNKALENYTLIKHFKPSIKTKDTISEWYVYKKKSNESNS